MNKSIIKIPSLKKGKLIILFISILFTFTVVIHYIITSGGHMVLNFKDVYIFRDQFGASGSSGIFGYINSWTSKIFAVLFFAWTLEKKKLFLIFISSSLILAMFIFSGHKGVLQGIMLTLFFYFLFNKIKKKELFILISFLFLIIFSLSAFFIYDFTMVASLLIRRLLILPAELNFVYFDFFTHHDFVYWSNGILKYFLNNPYQVEMTHVIGAYMGHPSMGANTGFMASAYMHAGIFGIIIYTILAIIIINLITNFSEKINKYIVMSIVFIPIKTMFISSDMLTTLLTHGLLVSIFTLWLYENKNYILKIGNTKYKV
jgi:oligosaccharide repeat unit polymerase